jgi:hypothetical protein
MYKSFRSTLKEVDWISDSGASDHVTGRLDWFSKYEEFKNPQPVHLTDNHVIYALGKGVVSLQAKVNGNWENCSISNTLYIPQAVNLFSEPRLAEKGYIITRDNVKTTFKLYGNPGPTATK